MVLAKPNLVSCNFPFLNHRNSTANSLQLHNRELKASPPKTAIASGNFCCLKPFILLKTKAPMGGAFQRRGGVHICRNLKKESEEVVIGGNGNGGGRDWTTSILLFFLWAALIYYVSFLSPNQTPSRDMYFLKKLLNLIGDDGFRMNEVLVSEWYLMGLWPLIYSMLLVPTGRSSKNNIPVWPFLVLSFFGGAYALIPYFVLWKPPAPPVEETQLKKWPLNFLESKVTVAISLAAGIAIMAYAGLAGGDVWNEFYQYFRESKFIHIMSIDFTVLSTLAPFWVYNDMTARKWFDKGSWLLPVSLIPLLGPGLYLLLRPSLTPITISQTSVEAE